MKQERYCWKISIIFAEKSRTTSLFGYLRRPNTPRPLPRISSWHLRQCPPMMIQKFPDALCNVILEQLRPMLGFLLRRVRAAVRTLPDHALAPVRVQAA